MYIYIYTWPSGLVKIPSLILYSFNFGWTGNNFLHYIEYRAQSSSHLFDVSESDIRIMVDVNVNTTLNVAGKASKHCAGFIYKQGKMIYNMNAFILAHIRLEFQQM